MATSNKRATSAQATETASELLARFNENKGKATSLDDYKALSALSVAIRNARVSEFATSQDDSHTERMATLALRMMNKGIERNGVTRKVTKAQIASTLGLSAPQVTRLVQASVWCDKATELGVKPSLKAVVNAIAQGKLEGTSTPTVESANTFTREAVAQARSESGKASGETRKGKAQGKRGAGKATASEKATATPASEKRVTVANLSQAQAESVIRGIAKRCESGELNAQVFADLFAELSADLYANLA